MNVLVLSPHTDDAELGTGATIARLSRDKNVDLIRWLVFSAAEESNDGYDLRKEFNASIGELKEGATVKIEPECLSYTVRRFGERRQSVLDDIIRSVKETDADLIIGPSPHDCHQDHQVIASEMLRAGKARCSVICYELPRNHVAFDAQLFSPVTLEQAHVKEAMLSCYRSQIKKSYFNTAAVVGQLSMRGAQIDEAYAEAFEVLRWRL